MYTRAVIVGASSYRQKEIFSPLRGAARDAVWFERFLRSKGVPGTDITCLIGETATKGAILAAIKDDPVSSRPFAEPHALIIFYSGHGGTLRLLEGRAECVLFCHDTSIRDRISSSIAITELLLAVSGVQSAEEIYIFLDACHLTLASVTQQLQVLAERARAAQVFCCIIANDGGVSVEGFLSPMGEFSSVLLASLQHVDDTAAPSIGALALEVVSRADRTGVTSPMSVLLGDLKRWPFRPNLSVSGSASANADVFRSRLVGKALELLRSNDRARVCIIGASGTGKSVVLRQVARLLGRCPIASFALADSGLSPESAGQRIVEAITAAMPLSDRQYAIARTIGTAVRAFATAHSHAVIAIDGGENLPDPCWFTILELFSQHGIDLITTRRGKSLPKTTTQDIEIEPMSIDELAKMPGVAGSKKSEDRLVRAYALSGGFPLPFLAALGSEKRNAPPAALLRTMQIVRTAGGFCSQQLFCALTGVDKSDLERLRTLGLLIQSNELYRLHDSAIKSTGVGIGDGAAHAISSYWQAEQIGKNSLTSSLMIIELCLNRELHFSAGTVAHAIRIAEGSVTSPALTNAAVAAAEGGDESALIEASDVLSRRGDGPLLATLLARVERAEIGGVNRVDSRVLLAKARAAWWAGEYGACRRYAKRVLESDQRKRRAALLELAIADFFEGHWSAAQDVLEQLAIPVAADLREVGWAQLILGTCLGIRGLDGGRGRTLLRSAAELLRATNDLAGVAIAKGNCGEVSWKSGDFEVSDQELREALELAESLGMAINAVESQRNLLQLYLRSGGPGDDRIAPLEQILERLSIEDIGRMEMMQVGNTIATLNLYRRNLLAAEKWVSMVRPLTAGNDEYDIYTRANDGLLLALTDRCGSREKVVAAAELCGLGQNRLALVQIRQDIVFCLGRTHTDLTSELIDIIDQRMKGIQS